MPFRDHGTFGLVSASKKTLRPAAKTILAVAALALFAALVYFLM